MGVTVPVFNTLAYAKKLEAAGVPIPIAEAQAEALADVLEQQLASKQNLNAVKVDLKHEIEKVRTDLTQEIKNLRIELIQEIESVTTELKQEIDKLKQEIDKLKQEIDKLKHEIDGLKREVDEFKREIKKDMDAFEQRLSNKIEKVCYQITIRLGSIMAAGIFLLGALIKLT